MLGLMNDQTHHIMTKKKKKGGDTVMTFENLFLILCNSNFLCSKIQ